MVRATARPPPRLDLGRHRLHLGARARGHRHRRSRPRQVEGDRAADPASAARDQGPASVQRRHCLDLNDLAGRRQAAAPKSGRDLQPARREEPATGAHVRGLLFLGRFEYVRRRARPGDGGGGAAGPRRARPHGPPRRRPPRVVSLRHPRPPRPRHRPPHGARRRCRLRAPRRRLRRASARNGWARTRGCYSVHGFLSRVAEQHSRLHSFGEATYRRRGFTEGELAFAWDPGDRGHVLSRDPRLPARGGRAADGSGGRRSRSGRASLARTASGFRRALYWICAVPGRSER